MHTILHLRSVCFYPLLSHIISVLFWKRHSERIRRFAILRMSFRSSHFLFYRLRRLNMTRYPRLLQLEISVAAPCIPVTAMDKEIV